MNRNFLIFGGMVALAVILGIVLALSGGDSTKTNTTSNADITSGRWMTGPESAKVTLTEFGDFQCPACGAMEPTVEQIRKDYVDTGKIKFNFRNFPLPQHQHAFEAAQAAEAAGKQNKYWEMHDKLYATQNDWEALGSVESYFQNLAKGLGLDTAKWKSDYSSSAVHDQITQDVSDGTTIGIQATPTFYVNNQQLTASNYADIKKVLDEQLSTK